MEKEELIVETTEVTEKIQEEPVEELVKKDKKVEIKIPKEKIESVKETLKVKFKDVKEKIEESKEKETNKIKPLVTSRVLFISALDKIYLIILILMFIGLTIGNFSGNLASLSYGFWSRVLREILIIIITVITYLILNWFYKCAAKTMLCLTENQVYREKYIPFKRSETSIPLNKITGITTYNVFWIFRTIIIHQYGKLPLIFFTWNNQEFKNELNKLITTEKDKVENEYENKNIISNYKSLKYISLLLIAIIMLIGIASLIGSLFSPERKIPGKYAYNEEEIILKRNGKCNIDDIIESVTKCSWRYSEYTNSIYVDYEYTSDSYYLGTSTYDNTITLDYNSKEKTLTYYGNIYNKK